MRHPLQILLPFFSFQNIYFWLKIASFSIEATLWIEAMEATSRFHHWVHMGYNAKPWWPYCTFYIKGILPTNHTPFKDVKSSLWVECFENTVCNRFRFSQHSRLSQTTWRHHHLRHPNHFRWSRGGVIPLDPQNYFEKTKCVSLWRLLCSRNVILGPGYC